mmetsp:Transcript_62217/g.184001  ORF Transcript_62217/g.184001 Transcript_62217/m.184001 type:complete len:304 (-) Transcript_62217:55-966(-)
MGVFRPRTWPRPRILRPCHAVIHTTIRFLLIGGPVGRRRRDHKVDRHVQRPSVQSREDRGGVDHLEPPQRGVPAPLEAQLLQRPLPIRLILHVQPLVPYRRALGPQGQTPQVLRPAPLLPLRHHERRGDAEGLVPSRGGGAVASPAGRGGRRGGGTPPFHPPKVLQGAVRPQERPLVHVPHEAQTVQLRLPRRGGRAPEKVVPYPHPVDAAPQSYPPRRPRPRLVVPPGHHERRRDEDVAAFHGVRDERLQHQVPLRLEALPHEPEGVELGDAVGVRPDVQLPPSHVVHGGGEVDPVPLLGVF